jgi:hypothetical protein
LSGIVHTLHQKVNSASTPIGVLVVLDCRMAEDAGIRLANFQSLWKRYGWTPSKLVAGCGNTPSYWSDLYHGRKSFGEKTARRIEDGMGLVRLSLDDAGGAQVQPFSTQLLLAVAALDSEGIRKAENTVRHHLDMDLLPRAAPQKRQVNDR